MITVAFFAYLRFNMFGDLLTNISAVGIFDPVFFVEEAGKPLAVMNRCVRYRIIRNDF